MCWGRRGLHLGGESGLPEEAASCLAFRGSFFWPPGPCSVWTSEHPLPGLCVLRFLEQSAPQPWPPPRTYLCPLQLP